MFVVERWAKQYVFSTEEGKSTQNPGMLELSDWLRQNIPQEDYSEATAGLVHGDFRIDNLVFHPTGHYIVDISLDKVEINGCRELTEMPEEVPPLEQYLADYCATAGKKPGPLLIGSFTLPFPCSVGHLSMLEYIVDGSWEMLQEENLPEMLERRLML